MSEDVSKGDCPVNPIGAHEFTLDEIVPGSRGGLALVDRCMWCDAISYEPSAMDDPNRPR